MSEYYKDSHRYEDIINLPHHQSASRRHMPLEDRAAQFSPFAALTGHEAAIQETARLTQERITLDAAQIERINETLAYIEAHLAEQLMIAVTYFQPDLRKSGGAYVTDLGCVKKVDAIGQLLVMDSGRKIPMQEVMEIQITGD